MAHLRAVAVSFFYPFAGTVTMMVLMLGAISAVGQSTIGSTVETHQYDSIDLPTLRVSIAAPIRSKGGVIPVSTSFEQPTGLSKLVERSEEHTSELQSPD